MSNNNDKNCLNWYSISEVSIYSISQHCVKHCFVSKPSTLQFVHRSTDTNLSKRVLTLKCSFCIILLSSKGNLAVSKLLISSTPFFNLCKKISNFKGLLQSRSNFPQRNYYKNFFKISIRCGCQQEALAHCCI